MTGIILNVLLFAAKYLAGHISGSVSVMADAFNNLMDAGTVLASLLGLKLAATAPGRKHQSGHGRLEWVVSLIMGVIVFQTGFALLQTALDAVLHPADTVFSPLAAGILLVSIGGKVILWLVFSRRAKAQASLSCKALALDSLCDAASTAAGLAALLLNFAFGWQVDGIFGLAVALLILYNSAKSIAESAGCLMGKAAPAAETEALIAAVGEFCPEAGNIYEVQIEDCGCGARRASFCMAPAPGVPVARLVEKVPALCAALKDRFGYETLIQTEKTAPLPEQAKLYRGLSDALQTLGCGCRIEDFRVDAAERLHIRTVISVPIHEQGALPKLRAFLEKPVALPGQKSVCVEAKLWVRENEPKQGAKCIEALGTVPMRLLSSAH